MGLLKILQEICIDFSLFLPSVPSRKGLFIIDLCVAHQAGTRCLTAVAPEQGHITEKSLAVWALGYRGHTCGGPFVPRLECIVG